MKQFSANVLNLFSRMNEEEKDKWVKTREDVTRIRKQARFMFDKTKSSNTMDISMDRAHLSYFQQNRYKQVNDITHVYTVFIGNRQEHGLVWGYIEAIYKPGMMWCRRQTFSVIDVNKKPEWMDEKTAINLLHAGANLFMRSDSQTGFSLTIEEENNGFSWKIPHIEYKHRGTSRVDWCQ